MTFLAIHCNNRLDYQALFGKMSPHSSSESLSSGRIKERTRETAEIEPIAIDERWWCENTANFFCLPISSLLLFFNYVCGKGLRAITEEHRNFLKEVLYHLALSYLLCGVGGFLRNQISDKTL